MSTDVLLSLVAVPLQDLSNGDVARAALIVTGLQALTGVSGLIVPFLVMRSVLDETARREALKEQKEERREFVWLAERQADRFLIAVVLVAAAILAVYLKD